MGAAGSDKISAWIWVALAALVLLALAVIFVLPNVVQQYELPLTPRVSQPVVETPAAPAVVQSASPAMSPFEEAQNARQRREAQDALASLLERQTELQVTNVTAWAAQEYEAAVASARRGDEFYRTANFADATLAYQEGDQALAQLQERRPQEFERLMTAGEAALQASDAATALASFSLAAQIDPTSAAADDGDTATAGRRDGDAVWCARTAAWPV